MFIDNAVPGDIVKARAVRINKNFIRAKIVEIITPSKYRVKPFCPLFNACGGCNLQNIEYDFLVEQKENILKVPIKLSVSQERALLSTTKEYGMCVFIHIYIKSKSCK